MVTEASDQNLDQETQNRGELEIMFDSMKEGIVVLDRGCNIIRINNAASRLLGLEKKAHTGQEVTDTFELFLPDGTSLPRDQWPSVRAVRGEMLRDFEVLIRRKDTGRIVIAEINSSLIPHSSGNPGNIIVSYHDVTVSRQVDQARARLAAIVESSEDAIIGKDRKGIVTSWNTGAKKIFGYTAEEVLGQSIRCLLPPSPEYQREEDNILQRIGKGEVVDHFDTVRMKKDGSLINVSLTISPIRETDGRIVGASKIARDVTDRRQLERQLRQSQKMEAVGQLTGGIAHDFNNLLGVILGNIDLLERLIPDHVIALKRLGTARKAALRGADLTRRMLTFSSKEELKPRAANLDESISNLVELASRALGPEIRLITHLEPFLPAVFVDVPGLESALLNLVVNARDAMPKGGPVTITTKLSHLDESYPAVQTGELKPGYYACVAVSDSGVGMSKEVLERAFEPFFTTKPRGKGTGLGLAMVYGFVKQSGGIARIYSEPGFGTTVSLYLPLALEAVQAMPAKIETAAPSTQTGTVLVVDDEEDLLEVAAAYLEQMGYKTLIALDAAAALGILHRHQVDLIITDIIMPGGMNGVELVQTVRQLHPETRFIYCSGFPSDALAERTMPAFDGPLLHKPYHRLDFQAIVRRSMRIEANHGIKH